MKIIITLLKKKIKTTFKINNSYYNKEYHPYMIYVYNNNENNKKIANNYQPKWHVTIELISDKRVTLTAIPNTYTHVLNINC